MWFTFESRLKVVLYIRREHGGHQEGAGRQQHQIQQSAQQKPVQILVTELLRAPATTTQSGLVGAISLQGRLVRYI